MARADGRAEAAGAGEAATGRREDPRHRSLFQEAYAKLREAIEDGSLEPGRRLMEVQVSEWLRISRTPAREAMRRLLSEGLLEHAPSGGLAVAVHDADAMRELYAVRESLEGTAAAMAARNAEPQDIEILREHVRIQTSLPPGVRAHSRENKLFHEHIYRAAHNRFLLKSVQALQDAMILLGERNFAVPGRIQSSIAEHEAMVEAIAAGDPGRAEAAARLHIRHGYESRIRAMTDAFRTAMLERYHASTAAPDGGHAAEGSAALMPAIDRFPREPAGRARRPRAPTPGD